MFSRWFKKTVNRQPSTVARTERDEIRCPLCGKTFRAEEAAQCETCALAKKCGLVMCPRCNYEFAP